MWENVKNWRKNEPLNELSTSCKMYSQLLLLSTARQLYNINYTMILVVCSTQRNFTSPLPITLKYQTLPKGTRWRGHRLKKFTTRHAATKLRIGSSPLASAPLRKSPQACRFCTLWWSGNLPPVHTNKIEAKLKKLIRANKRMRKLS